MSDELGKSLQHSVNQKFGSGTYQVLQPIKRGADGYVYKIQFIKQKKLGALKVLPRHNLSIQTSSQHPSSKKKYKADSALDQKAENQIKIHQSLRSNYVVKLYNSCKDDMNFYLFLELVSKGDLGDEISKFQHGLSIERIRKIGSNLAKGIDTIHKKGIVHRDIKPQNILLTDDDQIKICDFSCAKIINQDQGELLKGVVGTREYMAPQIMGKYGNSVDVWSFGCVMFALATGHPPFQISKSMINGYISEVNEKSIRKLNQGLNEQMLRIHREKSHTNQNNGSKRIKTKGEIKCECSEQSHLQCYKKLAHLLKRVLIFNVNERLSIQQVITHPFFTGSTLLREQQQQSQMKSQQTDRQKQLQTLQSKQNKYERTHISRPYSLQSMKKVLNYVNFHDQKQQKKEAKVFSKTAMMVIENSRNKHEIGHGTTNDNIVTGNKSDLYKKQNPNKTTQQSTKMKINHTQNNENTNTTNTQQKTPQLKTINAQDLIKHKLNNNKLYQQQNPPKIHKYISDEIPKPIQSGQLSSQYSSKQRQRQIPIALNCQNMNYKIQLTSELVTIDSNGFKAEFFKSDKVMMISPKGKHICLSYQGKTKNYQLERLPQKYMGHYEDYRQMVDKLKQSRSRKQLRDAHNYENQRQEQNGNRPCKTSRQKQLKQSTKRTSERPLSLKKPQPQKQSTCGHKSTNSNQTKAQIEQTIDLKIPIKTSKGLQVSETVHNISLINKISLKAGYPHKVQIILQHSEDNGSSATLCSRKSIDINTISVQRLRNILIQLVVCVVSGNASNQIQGLGKKVYELNKTQIEQWLQSSNKYLQWLSQFPTTYQKTQNPQKQQSTPLSKQQKKQKKQQEQERKQKISYLAEKQRLYGNRTNRHDQPTTMGINNRHYDNRIVLDSYISKYR